MEEMSVPITNAGHPRRSWQQKTKFQKRLFILMATTPAFGGYILFTLYPNLLTIYYSLLDWDGIKEPVFVGFQNFINMFQDQYVWRALWHNVLFMVTIPPLVIFISLILAYLMANKKYRFNSIYKVLFFFPNVLSTVAISLLWAFVYDGTFGLLNAGLRLIGIDVGNFYWLGEQETALWATIPPAVWGGVGFYFVIFMNAISTIPKSLYESAILEGASHTTRLFRITLPLIMPIIRVSAIFLILGVFKGFENILILTNGGPSGSTDVIGLYMFNNAFGTGTHNYGYASAIGMFLFVILVLAKLVIDKLTANRDAEY
ncbi:binding-protein-dependent transport systems inner membrane component [Paenibacillus baekrokdamisoli]|uniref:Binding-protein-dependent transport systems inner membrane component n=2 Tax=Paenibacillus baekrokdamisoli TaxID=1712516 RepID=A0A3G9JEB9_9BACL|nr:ABC-type sugar transport system permease subunit [Paenibacillus baekrokdamisoli]BBH24251.1 binding-protein-dependent transport systems inner membrane component [Paenibacillus baekrokdamisoli]